MFLLKIGLVVVLVLVIEKPTTRTNTRTSAILAFFVVPQRQHERLSW
jgi:hypothetical protein